MRRRRARRPARRRWPRAPRASATACRIHSPCSSTIGPSSRLSLCESTLPTTPSSRTNSPCCATRRPRRRRSVRWPKSSSPCSPTRRRGTCGSKRSPSRRRSRRHPGSRSASPARSSFRSCGPASGCSRAWSSSFPPPRSASSAWCATRPTLQPTIYAERLPDDLSNRQCFVIDPMLATGGSLIAAIDYLFERGAVDVTAICLIGAPEGLAAVEEATKGREVTIVLGALDEQPQRGRLHRPGTRRRRGPAVRHRRLTTAQNLIFQLGCKIVASMTDNVHALTSCEAPGTAGMMLMPGSVVACCRMCA